MVYTWVPIKPVSVLPLGSGPSISVGVKMGHMFVTTFLCFSNWSFGETHMKLHKSSFSIVQEVEIKGWSWESWAEAEKLVDWVETGLAVVYSLPKSAQSTSLLSVWDYHSLLQQGQTLNSSQGRGISITGGPASQNPQHFLLHGTADYYTECRHVSRVPHHLLRRIALCVMHRHDFSLPVLLS